MRFIILTSSRETCSRNMEVRIVFLGLEWYWWLVILAVLIVLVPFKIRFMKWWGRREQGKTRETHGKWGDDE